MKLKIITIATLLLAALLPAARAVGPNPPGTLALHVAISDDPEFSEKWVATAPSNSFVISRMSEARPGQTAYIGFLVTGYTVGPDGVPDITVDASVHTPDGQQLIDLTGCCSVRYKTDSVGFVMADPAVDLKFDSTDPSGTWTIKAVASDNLAGTTARAAATLELYR